MVYIVDCLILLPNRTGLIKVFGAIGATALGPLPKYSQVFGRDFTKKTQSGMLERQ